mgnify:CR=1 FL=1
MKFRNEAYNDLVSDLILDAFYVERSNRGKIASIRQYAEVVVRKILDLHEDDKVTLGDRGVIDKLKQVSDNNQLLMTSVEAIRRIGNKCTHTQETGRITGQDVLDCIDCLFKMYASIFVLYFKNYKFGGNNEVISAFSILPPIIRYLALNELHEQYPENLFVIDKLSLVLLKAFDKEHAVSWIEARKEKLVQTLPYTEGYSEQIKRQYGDILGQQVIDRAPENMYVLCTDRIIKVEEVIKKNGLLYNSFEQAKQLYLEKGILAGGADEILEFNSIMEFVYLGRKKEENSNLENIGAYTVLK